MSTVQNLIRNQMSSKWSLIVVYNNPDYLDDNLDPRCYPSLQAAMDDGRMNDIILIPTGIHSLLNINALRQGGTLMGKNNNNFLSLQPAAL